MPTFRSELLRVPDGVSRHRSTLSLEDGRSFIVEDLVKVDGRWEPARDREPHMRVFVAEDGERFDYVFAADERREIAGFEDRAGAQLQTAINRKAIIDGDRRRAATTAEIHGLHVLVDPNGDQWRIIDAGFWSLRLDGMPMAPATPLFRYFVRHDTPPVGRCFVMRGLEDWSRMPNVLSRQLAQAQHVDLVDALACV